ncbi:MAG: RNA polymerase sigma-70 factor [Chitinophagaceae bacterium]|nr:MAG: RNA polymerase sigma-70 factor [Chitinophagaceae bacterium]
MLSEKFTREKELLQRISEGDESAFREIYDLYKERFYAASLKMTRSPDIAEEIVQEVFVSLWIRRTALSNIENPTCYLFTIVYNSISAHFKKLALEKTMKQKVSEQMPEGECLTEDKLIEKENMQLLQHIMGGLPPQQQLIYHLSKEEGLSREEIASRLQISPNTVKNHLLKACKYIRLHFSKVMMLIVCLIM